MKISTRSNKSWYRDISGLSLPALWEEEIQKDWRHGHQFKLSKKGNLKGCKNWRGITLLSIPRKVFNRIVLERMKKEVDRLLREERSCTGHIATLRVITEQSLDWNSPLYITFIDFEKTFNSVDRTALWKLLAHYGIPEKIIRLFRTTYEPSTCQVVHNGSLTEPFSMLCHWLSLPVLWEEEIQKDWRHGHQCLRVILHIKWQDNITNEEIWRRTGHTQTEAQIKRRKWDWLGHTLRKPTSSVVRHALKWNPQDISLGGRWDTPGVSWTFCPETGPSGGSLWSTYVPQGYKSSEQVATKLLYFPYFELI